MAVYTRIGAREMAALIDRFGVGALVSAKGIADFNQRAWRHFTTQIHRNLPWEGNV